MGIFLAPLATLLVVIPVFAQAVITKPPPLGQIPGYIFIFLMFCSGFYVSAFLVTAFVGAPIHLLLDKLKIDHWAVYTGLGLIIGFAYDRFEIYVSHSPDFGTYPISMASGAVVAFAFWLVAARKKGSGCNFFRTNE
ncbi:hypothetical protein [Gallaecimonas sp. GXIMD1310]|uniref:hypothetical protein n=1 Tax=Gallaecimonas sp. GXIMD1310 TaxID=3131926 RepID=UPI003243435A